MSNPACTSEPVVMILLESTQFIRGGVIWAYMHINILSGLYLNALLGPVAVTQQQPGSTHIFMFCFPQGVR